MSQKVKRRVNRSKRAKLNTHGFKVHKGFYLHIGKSTEGGWSRAGKPAVRPELVDVIRKFWNSDPCIRKICKHIKGLSITYHKTGSLAGTWDYADKIVRIFDDGRNPIDEYISILIHEVVGHAFWDLSRKWRREEVIKFNLLANQIPALTSYIKNHEDEWRKINDDNDDAVSFEKSVSHIPEWDASEELCNEYSEKYNSFKKQREENGHYAMTRFANETHSAVSEIVYGIGGHKVLVEDSNVQRLVDLWKELHY